MKNEQSGLFWALGILLTALVATVAAVTAIQFLHRRKEDGYYSCGQDDWEEDQLVHFEGDPADYDIEEDEDPETIKF